MTTHTPRAVCRAVTRTQSRAEQSRAGSSGDQSRRAALEAGGWVTGQREREQQSTTHNKNVADERVRIICALSSEVRARLSEPRGRDCDVGDVFLVVVPWNACRNTCFTNCLWKGIAFC